MIPAAFRARRALENLNVAGVGLALASITAVLFSLGFHDWTMAWFTGLPTLVIGTLWARLLRWPKTVQNSSLRLGWLLSIPLAALNASLSAAMLLGFEHGRFELKNFFLGFVAGATLGLMFWVPALVLTLLCFGLPVAWSQRLAQRGLAGQERGEMVVGTASLLIGLAALVLTVGVADPRPTLPSQSGVWFAGAMSLAASLCAVAAMVSAGLRASRRRAFVAEVEAGRVEKFRVDASDEGKVLVRVVTQGQGYRVADLEEEIAAFDREGNITRATLGEPER